MIESSFAKQEVKGSLSNLNDDIDHDEEPEYEPYGCTSSVGDVSEHSYRQQQDQDIENPTDGAENLVRSEARAVRFLRTSLMVLLITAALVTSFCTHRLAAKNQIDHFTRDFENLAAKLVNQFEIGIGSYLYQSFTLSEAISKGLYVGSKPTFPDVTLEDLDSLASGLRLQARALDVIWSPLLRTRAERASWETYAETTLHNSNSSTSKHNQPCYPCGVGNEIANLKNLVEAPGVGTFSCGAVQQASDTGVFAADQCELAKRLVPSNCGCKKSDGTIPQQNSTSSPFWDVKDGIFRLDNNGNPVRDHTPTPFSPVWQFSPAAGGGNAVMFNQMSDVRRRKAINAMIQYNIPIFGESFDPKTNAFYNLVKTPATNNGIVGVLFYPVYQSADSNTIAGSLAVDFSWKLVFEININKESDGIEFVLENSCGQMYTFKVVGNQVEYVGDGDLHDTNFDALMVQSSFDDFLKLLASISPRRAFQNISSNWGCAYRLRVYPSSVMRAKYLTNKPWTETLVVVSIFVFTSSVFLLYDFILQRLQNKVVDSAKQSEAIVSSMFPEVVRDRLYNRNGQTTKNSPSKAPANSKQGQVGHCVRNHKLRLKTFLAQPTSEDLIQDAEPIADLFPNTTILFADIAGFTAWSSEREPAQVFKLLETLYGAFDLVAKRLGVFKIETIGDCYVAVSGLPDPREDHAVIMVKFASECLLKAGELTKQLETSLGPGTADLALRVGLHSGPVTGGVLRGERARFQLFGDTMNTASRMESNGRVNSIHVSKDTAQLLIKAGKADWVEQRSELIAVKGKGELQTYWVKPTKPRRRKASMSSTEDGRSSSGHNFDLWGASSLDATLAMASSLDKKARLVEWNADLLEHFLQNIVAHRKAAQKIRSARSIQSRRNKSETNIHIVSELKEIIPVAKFSELSARAEMDPSHVDVGAKVRSQLRDYVSQISALYHDNSFHNFEHASHVVMAASKLLKRIIAPDDVDYRVDEAGKTLKSNAVLSKEIHDTTYGISSDPLMQFAVVFSALIHDVDHTGLPNRQLVKMNDPLALTYLGKCVAEQQSVRCAWEKLMEDKYADLRRCIHHTEEERVRFRQLVINAVIATDIADNELREWRQSRWHKAFYEDENESTMDRRATLLFEYIIQASDVAPTMQHWHIYQKWNQRLFQERYTAYVVGNGDDDPSVNWYQDELAFFDNYVIPLAKNLEESHVFGVSCDDYLAYALENRQEWEAKGELIIREIVAAQPSYR